MLRTTDIIMVVVMTAAATVTYSIKHRAELKLEQVRKIDSDIKLEKDTIDLLKADWALLTQPNRLQRLITAYQADLQLVPTASTQLAQPQELPMLKADVPPPPPPKTDPKKKGAAIADASKKKPAADDGVAAIIAGSASVAPVNAAPVAPVAAASAPAAEAADPAVQDDETDGISTGSVAQ